MKIVGLTGGVASGKSTAGVYFAELGIPVIDADEIARDLRAPGGEAHSAILARFGTATAAELRKIVFSDPQAKKDLEAILHPLIQKKSEAEFTKHARLKVPYLIYEAALLIETGRHSALDGLIVVSLSESKQIERLMKRDRLEESVARQMIGAQSPSAEKEKHATFVLRNDSTLDDLKSSVRQLHTTLSR